MDQSDLMTDVYWTLDAFTDGIIAVLYLVIFFVLLTTVQSMLTREPVS